MLRPAPELGRLAGENITKSGPAEAGAGWRGVGLQPRMYVHMCVHSQACSVTLRSGKSRSRLRFNKHWQSTISSIPLVTDLCISPSGRYKLCLFLLDKQGQGGLG